MMSRIPFGAILLRLRKTKTLQSVSNFQSCLHNQPQWFLLYCTIAILDECLKAHSSDQWISDESIEFNSFLLNNLRILGSIIDEVNDLDDASEFRDKILCKQHKVIIGYKSVDLVKPGSQKKVGKLWFSNVFPCIF